MKKNFTIERPDGHDIPVSYHYARSDGLHSKFLVVFIHGMPKAQSDHNNFFGFLADDIVKYGTDSLVFDFSYCDYSNGDIQNFSFETAFEDLDTIYEWAEDQGVDKIGLIAEGLGVAIAVSNPPENCFMGIFCWPAFDLKYVRNVQFQANQKAELLDDIGHVDYDRFKIGKALLRDLEKRDIIAPLNGFKAPTLILHGEHDKIIPITHLELAREHLMARRLEITVFNEGEYGLEKPRDRRASLMHISQFLKHYVQCA